MRVSPERRRALAFATAIGLSVLVLGVASSGVAVAAAGNLSVSPDPVNSSSAVSVTAVAATPGNDLTFAVDGDRDGAIQATEALGTASSNGSTGNGSVSTSLATFVAGEGSYQVYVVEEPSADGVDNTSYPVADPATYYDANASVEVDDTAPSIDAFAVSNPEERDVVVSFDASERLSDVRVEVRGEDAGTLSEVDFVSTGSGPYTYEASYFPASDGEYEVVLEVAQDAAGNDGAGGETGSVVAAVEGRNGEAVFGNSSSVFLGETGIDASPVFGDGVVTFESVGSASAGRVVRADASDLDVTEAAGFGPGHYDATGDGTGDLVVERPTIDDLGLVLENGSNDVDVGDAYLQRGDSLTVRAAFDFEAADELTVSVRGPSGVDLAPTLTEDVVLETSGEAIRLDTGAADLETGTYSVTVSAEELNATATVPFELVDRETSVSVDRTRVVRGSDVTATVFGRPGRTVVVRLPVSDLANESTAATDVFEHTGDVRDRTGSTEHVAVELALGRDGIGLVRFDTAHLEADVATVETVDGSTASLDASASDEVRVDVASRRVRLADPPRVAAINEEVTVEGTAPQIDAVKAYVRIGDAWQPLGESEWVGANVSSNGTFELSVPVSGELAIPGTYRVAIVGVPDTRASDLHENESITRESVTSRPSEIFTVRTSVGGRRSVVPVEREPTPAQGEA